MADENKKQRTRWERLKDNYRLVIMNKDTFEEVGSYNLSLLNVYVLLSTLAVVVTVVVVLAISFTPLRRLVPGYANGAGPQEMAQLNNDLDSLTQLAKAQERYNEGFRRMLVGEVQYEPEERPQTNRDAGSIGPEIGRSEAEEQLRQEVEMEDIRDATAAEQPSAPVNISPRDIPLEQMYFSAPIGGTVSAPFDKEKNHLGVDVIAPKNTPVKTVMDGWVIFSDWTLETGNTIAIQHTNNIVTFYKHNSALLKKTGNYVKAGEAIAIIGNTGELTDGPHLHFELWHSGKPVNPMDFVNFK
jgi:murein DD-endopeptidase MepM/ murein hydrolase activator NlpD